MTKEILAKAKQMFLDYNCSKVGMYRDVPEVIELYESYNVPRELEEEWTKEQQELAKQRLLNAKNNRELARAFCDYDEYSWQLHDKVAFKFMLDFVEKNCFKYDTETSSTLILTMVEAARSFHQYEKQVIQDTIKRVEILLEREITIDESYKENGKYPLFLSKEELKERLQDFLDYYKKKGY